jgi:hypothetical protein
MTLLGMFAEIWQELKNAVSDPYRPERHYMRGPGPKWRARQNLDLPSVS